MEINVLIYYVSMGFQLTQNIFIFVNGFPVNVVRRVMYSMLRELLKKHYEDKKKRLKKIGL